MPPPHRQVQLGPQLAQTSRAWLHSQLVPHSFFPSLPWPSQRWPHLLLLVWPPAPAAPASSALSCTLSAPAAGPLTGAPPTAPTPSVATSARGADPAPSAGPRAPITPQPQAEPPLHRQLGRPPFPAQGLPFLQHRELSHPHPAGKVLSGWSRPSHCWTWWYLGGTKSWRAPSACA